jgi:hypothetical protein
MKCFFFQRFYSFLAISTQAEVPIHNLSELLATDEPDRDDWCLVHLQTAVLRNYGSYPLALNYHLQLPLSQSAQLVFSGFLGLSVLISSDSSFRQTDYRNMLLTTHRSGLCPKLHLGFLGLGTWAALRFIHILQHIRYLGRSYPTNEHTKVGVIRGFHVDTIRARSPLALYAPMMDKS